MPGRESLPARILRIEGLPITAVLLVLVALFMLVAPEVFLSYRIYMSFLANVPPLLVLAAGLTLLIAAGEIDLSFPSIVALSGWVLAYCIHEHQAPWLGLMGFFTVAFMLSLLIFIGEAVRDAFDPRKTFG